MKISFVHFIILMVFIACNGMAIWFRYFILQYKTEPLAKIINREAREDSVNYKTSISIYPPDFLV